MGNCPRNCYWTSSCHYRTRKFLLCCPCILCSCRCNRSTRLMKKINLRGKNRSRRCCSKCRSYYRRGNFGLLGRCRLNKSRRRRRIGEALYRGSIRCSKRFNNCRGKGICQCGSLYRRWVNCLCSWSIGSSIVCISCLKCLGSIGVGKLRCICRCINRWCCSSLCTFN